MDREGEEINKGDWRGEKMEVMTENKGKEIKGNEGE